VKRLKQAQYPVAPHMIPTLVPGINPYYAMAGHPPNPHIGYGSVDGNAWNAYSTVDMNSPRPVEKQHELREFK
jgi:hypothetical protein